MEKPSGPGEDPSLKGFDGVQYLLLGEWTLEEVPVVFSQCGQREVIKKSVLKESGGGGIGLYRSE